MLIEVKGVVVRVNDLTGNDKLLTIFTEERGLMRAVSNGSRSLKSRYLAASQLFCYASFILEAKGDRYWLRESDLIESFYDLRLDIVKTALGQYILDVAADAVVPEQPDPELLRLTLNTLYAITKGLYPLNKIKAAFEFRAAALLGFAPDLTSCGRCGKEEGDGFLDVMNGCFYCNECHLSMQTSIPSDGDTFEAKTARILSILTPGVRVAAGYVMTAPVERVFAFRLQQEDLRLFCRAAEDYLLNHLERSFNTLHFYHEVAT